MLALTRNRGERIFIYLPGNRDYSKPDLVLVVTQVRFSPSKDGIVTIGFDADSEILILREEVVEKNLNEQQMSLAFQEEIQRDEESS